MSKEEIEKLSRVEVGDDYEVVRMRPAELLTPANYVDILAKYLYAKAHRDGTLTDWTVALYLRHLMVRNRLFDGVERASAAAFRESFHALLDSIAKEGFDEKRSIVSVTRTLDILDGYHRVAAALLYGGEITVVKTARPWPAWGADSFRKRGLEETFLDQASLEYCRVNPHARLAVIFPIVKDKYEAIRDMLAAHTVYYEKHFVPTIQGVGNLIAQMYKPKDWLNAATRDRHAVRRFVRGAPVRILLLNPKTQEDLVKTKAGIRKMFDHENLPIHTSDDREETLRVAEQVFNEHSIHFWNNAHPTKFENFSKLFERYKEWIRTNHYDKDEFCVDGSAVLAAYGLRDCGDFDYLSLRDTRSDVEKVRSHNDFLYLHSRPLVELVSDPRNYFYYDGHKFLALEREIEFKARRRDPQDARDVALMRAVPAGKSFPRTLGRALTPKRLWNHAVMHGVHALWRMYILLPKKTRPFAVKLYGALKKIYQAVRKLVWKY
ncbi:MAG: hypothetical protein HYW65_00450 [Candidatus Liptonbacteria bacterium]|nr:hypothetical protein [Candidatus Liptonbacteria bacterium]